MAAFASFILSFNCCCWTPITLENFVFNLIQLAN